MPFDNSSVRVIKSDSQLKLETRINFTVRNIPSRVKDGQPQTDFWDLSLPGFGMRVSAGGTRTWIAMYRYNGMKRRMKLGNYPKLGLADARDAARAALRKAEDGQDPAAEKKRLKARLDTVEDLIGLYIEDYAKVNKRSWKKDEQILNREVKPVIGSMRVIDVRRQDIRSVLEPIERRGAKVRANHTLGVVRKMFNWAIIKKDIVMTNPAAGMEMPGKVSSRTRWLDDNELVAFWDAMTFEELGQRGVAAFQILMLTGQREMEVLRMRWQDIDFEKGIWTIPGNVAKNEHENVIPLTAFMIGLLMNLEDLAAPDDVYVFENPDTRDHFRRVFVEKRIIKIREATKLENVRIHDLRRTMTTYLGLLRVEQPIKKKILNHVKRNKNRDVTEVYDRFEYLDEKRTALAKWEKLLLGIVGNDFYADNPEADAINSVKEMRLGRAGVVPA